MATVQPLPWRALVSPRPAPPQPAARRWMRFWQIVAAIGALLHLLILLDAPPQGRDAWIEWLSSVLRTLAVLGIAAWAIFTVPWRRATTTDERRAPITAILALAFATTWCVVIWLNDDMYTDAWRVWLPWYMSVIALLLQAHWLVRSGFVSAGALALLGSMVIYMLNSMGKPDIGNELVYVMIVLIASMLLRWWAGFVVAVSIPAVVLVCQLVGLAPGEPRPSWAFFIGVLYLVIATIAGLYTHALEGAVTTADQRANDLEAAQGQLQAQHGQLQAQAAELTGHRSRLEHEVAARTAELEEALADLRRNAVALRELQTPVVPVLPGVLVVPLIGAFDTERSSRFVADMLQAVERHGARTVLIDVTGLPVIDTHAARTLLQTAAAARLLGASVTLVGVAPETAQTIVGLGLDLGEVRAERDLQSAVDRLAVRPALERPVPARDRSSLATRGASAGKLLLRM